MFGTVDMAPTVSGGSDSPRRGYGTGDLPGHLLRSAADARHLLASVAQAGTDEIGYRSLVDHIDEVSQA
ncbi:hypothetical protein ACFYQ5_08510 [Streptomyces sp. NPDC005794]|uniref:hypothetical protein n=1 Tax=Streptomyces sp. NPDC005794 TaxID=3364733 RepID=UPI0036779011